LSVGYTTIVQVYNGLLIVTPFVDIRCLYFEPWFWTATCCGPMRVYNLDNVSYFSAVENCHVCNILPGRISVLDNNLVSGGILYL
jgi:hypothetical protein